MKKTTVKKPKKIKEVLQPEPSIDPVKEELKPVEPPKIEQPKVRVFTEQEKQFMKDNNMDEYIRHFGKPCIVGK